MTISDGQLLQKVTLFKLVCQETPEKQPSIFFVFIQTIIIKLNRAARKLERLGLCLEFFPFHNKVVSFWTKGFSK